MEIVLQVRLSPDQQRRLFELGHLSADEAMTGQGFIQYNFPPHSDELRCIVERLEEEGIEYHQTEQRHFTHKEIRSATALHVAPAPSRGVDRSGGGYDYSEVCDRCMRVPSQVGPLTVSGSYVGDQALVRGRRGELLVSETIAVRMIKESITGCILREVRETTDEPSPSEAYFQVLPTRVLPQTVSPPTRFSLSDDACPTCGRGGLHLESMLYYDLGLDDVEDLNVTAELFGEGAELHPEMIVSQRFYNLLVSCGAALPEPEPVLFL